jgi:molybdate transport system substrate-binding protein
VSRTRILAPALALALLVPAGGSAGRGATKITVFAAASLTQTFPAIDRNSRYSFAGSDQLARQIQQGAPADVYAAASPKYTQRLYHNGFLRKPVTFATNRLIVLVPRANPARIRSVYDLRRAGVKVVIGDRTVPIGSYTRQILDALGIANDVMKNVVSQATDVKAIVGQVALGQADASFVYATDARPVASRTKVIGLPRWAQPPIRYELGVLKAGRNQAAARAFVHKVLSKRGRTLLRKAGFGLPSRPRPRR